MPVPSAQVGAHRWVSWRVAAMMQSPRPPVVARTVHGGTRSPRDSRPRTILQSMVATRELHGLDPLAELVTLLRASCTPLVELPPV